MDKNDMISRNGTSAWLEHMGHPGLAKMVMDEKRFPPAQPEITRCKDCKHFDPIYTGGAGVCGHWNAKTESNVYCAYAERKTE